MSQTAVMTLTDFLRARITEREALARAALNSHEMHDWDSFVASAGMYAEPVHDFAVVNTPTLMLAECEAKRHIVELHPLVSARDVWGDDVEGLACELCDIEPDFRLGGAELARSDGCATLRAITVVYADHPDYRDEWRP